MSPKSIISSPHNQQLEWKQPAIRVNVLSARGWSWLQYRVYKTLFMWRCSLKNFYCEMNQQLASYRKCTACEFPHIQHMCKKSSYLLNEERVGETLLVRKQTGERCVFPHRSAQRVSAGTPSSSGGSGTNRAPRSKAEREGGRGWVHGSGAHVYDLWSLRTRQSAAWILLGLK